MEQGDLRKVLAGVGIAALVAGVTAAGCAGLRSS